MAYPFPDGPIPEIRNIDDNQISIVLKELVDFVNAGGYNALTGPTGPTGPNNSTQGPTGPTGSITGTTGPAQGARGPVGATGIFLDEGFPFKGSS